MYPHLDTIAAASRQLVCEECWSLPVRKLAYTVMHGAELIDRHHLDERGALPQFGRALYHLCHATARPLCGNCMCDTHPDMAECACIARRAS